MTTNRNLRVRAIRDYDERIRELTEAFNLPDDVREWVTVRFDPDADDETIRYQVTVHAQAGRTVATLEVDGTAALRNDLEKLIRTHRESLHGRLKADLATNLMAGINSVPVGGSDGE